MRLLLQVIIASVGLFHFNIMAAVEVVGAKVVLGHGFIKTVWQNDIKSQMKVQKDAQQTLENHKNPMAYALSELMKGQLELTAHFLSSQKSLYANYCGNLGASQVKFCV